MKHENNLCADYSIVGTCTAKADLISHITEELARQEQEHLTAIIENKKFHITRIPRKVKKNMKNLYSWRTYKANNSTIRFLNRNSVIYIRNGAKMKNNGDNTIFYIEGILEKLQLKRYRDILSAIGRIFYNTNHKTFYNNESK